MQNDVNMSGKFDSLYLLDSLLLDSLTKAELILLANELHKQSCLSQDALETILKVNSHEDLASAILNAIFQEANPGLVTGLVLSLKKVGKHVVAEIIECYFDPNERQRVAWILHAWNDLLKQEKHIKELTCFLTTKKLSNDHWLLDFCYFIASEETDSEVKTKLIDMLQNSMSDSETSMVDTTGFEFISLSNVRPESAHTSYEPPHQVQNFDIASTSSSDSKENYVDAPTTQEQQQTIDTSLKEYENNSLKVEKTLHSNLPFADADRNPGDVITTPHFPSQENDDVEMADDSSSIGVISDTMEVVPLEEVNSREESQQEQSNLALDSSKGTITEDLDIPDAPPSLHQDVDQTLFPLLPLLQSCLSKKDVKNLVKEMFTLKHLTRETFEKLKALDSETVGMVLHHLISALRKEASENWRQSLLEAFEELEKNALLKITEKYFTNASKDLCWLITNSDAIQNRREDLFSIAERLNLSRAIADHEEHWFVHLLHEAMLVGDDTLRQIITALTAIDEQQDEQAGENLPKTPAERIDEMLNPLMPLLKSCMDGKEIVRLVKELAVLDYCSNDEYLEFRSFSSSVGPDETFSSFIAFMKHEAKENWEVALLKALEERECWTLHNVVAYYFKNPSALSWFLQNWDMLQERPESLFSAAQELGLNIHVDKEAKSWLLSFLNEIIKLGDAALMQIVAVLTPSDGLEGEKIPKTLAEQIDEELTPLMPLLSSYMTSKEIVNLVKELVVAGYTERNRLIQFRSLTSSFSLDETLSSFVNFVKDEAKENWKVSILTAIKEREHEILADVVQYYFEKPESFSWILQNWEILRERKEKLIAFAEKFNINIAIDEPSQSWLLCYLSQIIKHGNEALAGLVATLSQEPSPTNDLQQEVDEDPRALFLKNMEESLTPLISLFKSTLSLKDFLDIASELCVSAESISRASLNSLKQMRANQGFESIYIEFINCMKNDAQENWKTGFLEALVEEKHEILADVVQYYFEKPESFSWILQNWEILRERKEKLIAFAEKFNINIAIDEPSQSWLLCYLSQIIKHGNEALAGLVATLSQEPSPTNDLQQEVDEDPRALFLKNMEESLTPLISLFKSTLSLKDFLDIASELCVSAESISRASLNSLKQMRANQGFESIYIEFINCMKNDAQENWKTGFLEALVEENHIVLHEVVAAHFEKPHSILWFLHNWEVLLNRKLDVFAVAQKLNMYLSTEEDDKTWLLCFLNKVLKQGDEVLQRVISFLCEQKVLEPSEEEKRASEEVSGAFARYVQVSLTPLIPLLACCLPPSKLVNVAEAMRSEGNCSADTIELLKMSFETTVQYQDSVQVFIDNLKNDAEVTWKASFLQAVKSKGSEVLHFVIQRYFLFPNEHFLTAFANWEIMEARKQDLAEAAYPRGFCADLNIDSDDIVLQIIRNAISRGSKALEILLDVFLHGKDTKKETAPGAPQSRSIAAPQSKPIAAPQSKPIVAPQSRPIVKEKLPQSSIAQSRQGPVTRSQTKGLAAASAPGRNTEAISPEQVTIEMQSHSPKFVSRHEHTIIGQQGVGPGTPPKIPLRSSSVGRGRAVPVFCPGKSEPPSLSESEESLKETSFTSGSDVEPPKLQQGAPVAADKETEEPKSSEELFQNEDNDGNDVYSDAQSELDGSNVKKLVEEFEIIDEKMPPLTEARQQKEAGKGDGKKKGTSGKKNDGKPTYANMAGTSAGKGANKGGKNKPVVQPKPAIPVKLKSIADQEFTPARLQKLTYGNCFVEFRARLSDASVRIPDGSTLFLYLDNMRDRGYYPMQFYPKFNEYRLALTLYALDTLVYKYCTGNDNGNITGWEHLVYHRDRIQDGIYNRWWTTKAEQRDSRYCVTFDVVVLQKSSMDEFKNHLVATYCKFLHYEFVSDEHNSDENALIRMHFIYKNWFIGLENGTTTQKRTPTYMDQPSRIVYRKETKVNSVLNFIMLLLENENVASRVLCTLAFLTALSDEIKLEEQEVLVGQMCLALSVHDITDESHTLLAVHLEWFKESWNTMKKSYYHRDSLLGIVEALFRKLAKIPESLLVFPMLKMLQSLFNESKDPTAIPRLNIGAKYFKPEWESFGNQEIILEIGKKVVRLIERFPWMKKAFATMVTVETTSKILQNRDARMVELLDADIIFAKLIEFWNAAALATAKDSEFNEGVVTSLISYIAKKINQITNSERQESDDKCAQQWLVYADKLLGAVTKYVSNHSKRCNVGAVVFLVTLIDDIIVFGQTVQKNTKNKTTTLQLDNVLNALVRAPGLLFDSPYATAAISRFEIELWSTLLDYDWHSENVKNTWKFNCEDALQYCLKQKFTDAEAFINFYANDFETMRPSESLVKCVLDVLTSKVENDLEGSGKWYSFDVFSKPSLLKVIWKIFKKRWFLGDTKTVHGSTKEESLLLFLEQWPPAIFFLCKLCEGWKNTNKRLSTAKRNVFSNISRSIRAIMLSLDAGSISIASLMMLENVKKFWYTYDAFVKFNKHLYEEILGVGNARYYSATAYEKLLKLRLEELKMFHEIKNYLDDFVKFAASLKKEGIDVDCDELQERLDVKLRHYELRGLVECKDPTKNNGKHKVLHFPVKDIDLQIITDIMETNCLSSVYARLSITASGKACETPKHSISSFLAKVWVPAYGFILNAATKLDEGTITFSEVDQILEKDVERTTEHVDNQVQIFYNILRKEGGETENMALRSEQIQNYLIVRRQQKTAQVLLDIKGKLKLKGRFGAIKKPLKDDGPLNSISRDTLKAISSLEDITDEQLRVLRHFRRGDLLQWVKEHMKDLGEVKVMSDLAMISAGETPMEVDRVSCFLSAVMGFSPIIFDLPQEAGFTELLKACKEVFKNVERDKKEQAEREGDGERKTLLQKWVAISKQMEWLKVVKEMRGSVEKSSLTRAQQINKRGIYIIGKEQETIPNVENCLKLLIPKDEKLKIQRVEMSLSELHDLQSRLMLIAGEADKGKDDVTRFINVLSSAENLAKAYVQLKLSGCLLFNDWFADIRCCKDYTERYVTLEVSFDTTSPKMTSKREILQEIKELTDVLQEAHQNWMNYLFEKRNEHYHLNHYNIHQLTYLCKKLSRMEGNDFPDQVYQLLAGIASNLNYGNITDCLEEVTKITDEPEQADAGLVQEVGASDSKLDKKKRVIRKLVQLELTEKVAKAAVQCVPSLDVDECYLWALEYGTEEEVVVEHQRKFDEEVDFETSKTDIHAIQDVINDRLHLTLEQVISRIQRDLEERNYEGVGVPVKTVCERYFGGTSVTSLEDCISLEHLGQFLSMISHYSAGQMKVPERKSPEGFHIGKPNLIVCPKVDMWRTILSIYMQSPDQGLPTATEVLVCCESTTTEEVELLLRRALQTPTEKGTRIFCLACADEIDFNVAKAAESLYQQLNQMSGRNSEFRLIVLSTSLHHYITAVFDESFEKMLVIDKVELVVTQKVLCAVLIAHNNLQYRVDVTFMADVPDIKKYICDNLMTKDMKMDSASIIDHNRNLVRLICSDKAGMGKSLYVKRRREKLAKKFAGKVHWNSSTIRFLEKNVDVDDTIDILTHAGGNEVTNIEPHFVHIDITPAVHNGVHKFLFDLMILGELKSSGGVVWKRCLQHYYALEYTFSTTQGQVSFSNLLELLPSITCISPIQVLDHMKDHGNQKPDDQILMDETLLMNEIYQRPFQYLLRYKQELDLDRFSYKTPTPDALLCLQTLLQYCSIENPSWSELSHFSKFLNTQLHDCERSYYLNIEDLGLRQKDINEYKIFGFKLFAVKFMIRMSQDFATPSLKTNEEEQEKENRENVLFELHQLRRRWEKVFHPYLFFNADRMTFSFVHFNISDNGHLCNPKTNEVDEQNIMKPQLVKDLKVKYKVKIQQDFDRLSREEKLETLCNVFGVNRLFDPDPSYELTTDNVLKMLAIHMRFRCGIPVVIMGETGCGKTRMVDFMSKLKCGGDENVENMVVVKVHGGITVAVIQKLVKEAVALARTNQKNNLETILFLDEANTTEAIYAIKEIVCDETVHGEPFTETGLKIVAACNPYKKHEDYMIERMEQSGLGFHVKTEDVTENFAGIPMRHLVYRVIPLPPSMQPLVWDFGQLNNDTEEIYIKQMVLKMQNDINDDGKLDQLGPETVNVVTKCLSTSQKYMRDERDVCSFVSLRDVERTIVTFKWFYKQLGMLNPQILKQKNKNKVERKNFPKAVQALIHALGVCYHVTLDDRRKYRKVIAKLLQVDQEEILDEIIACQNVFINDIELEKDIGRNEALTENVFMMVVCAELRIPLFLVGKPGSSKSLAKTIVTDAMQGRNSKGEIFKKLKQIHVSSFQCSAVSDAVGIEVVFTQCARLQKNQSMDEFVAVVVLDEIGLAEDSPKMPLKVLHPLLENASTNTQLAVEPHSKVGFVGISNWALDPAKMNRGIFVTRGKPSHGDLQKTAEAIFESDKEKIKQVSNGVIRAVTSAYLQIYETQDKEFFGLRDYYGLLKMLCSLITANKEVFFGDIAELVLRNFSGRGDDAFQVFRRNLENCFDHVYDVKIPVMDLIQKNLISDFESRFLLLLTNQYAAVSLLPKVMDFSNIDVSKDKQKIKGLIQDYQVIFGSSFRRDNDYTEVCRNINRIKVCMETGRTVVLLNLRDLYESLYDALNQHYVTFAGQRYVDLGLGGHRVKCRIATNFRLIVIEEKEVVYNNFPIPLINRLEKHVFEMNSVLTHQQANLVERLKEWIARFATFKRKFNLPRFATEDTFPGYTVDTPASALVSSEGSDFDLTKKILLQTASLDGVCRLPKTSLTESEANKHMKVYMEEQNHDSLLDLLQEELKASEKLKVLEVTSFSQILHKRDRLAVENELHLNQNSVMLLTLQQFQTERSFSERLDKFFETVLLSPRSRFILLIQCPQAQLHGNLIACAKYATMNKVKEFQPKADVYSKVLVLFLFTMERNINAQNDKASFTSFHSQNCHSLYVDELKSSRKYIASISYLWNLTIPAMIQHALEIIGPRNTVLDFHRLVNDCIPEAIAKIKVDGHFPRLNAVKKHDFGGSGDNDDDEGSSRNRIRILNGLCFQTKFCDAFLKILGRHIWHLLRDREKQNEESDHWIVEVACSPQALQEAGSFKNAVWLHLRKLVAVAVAKIVSVLDSDNNLNLVEDPSLNELWLQIFDRPPFFGLHWPDPRLVNAFYVKTLFSCSFPFFRLFVEHLNKQWVIVQDRNVEDKRDGFLKGLKESSTMLLLDQIPNKSAVLLTKRFVHDLVCFLYKSRSNRKAQELKTVESCVFNLFHVRREKDLVDNNAIVEVFFLYKEIQSNLQHFSTIIAVRTDILNDQQAWIEEQLKHSDFVAHKLALQSLVKLLHDEAPTSINAVGTCEQWKSVVNKVKPVSHGLILKCSDEIQQMWTRVVFVEIFLDQLVPTSASDEAVKNYLATIAPFARRLSVGAKKIDQLSKIQFLNIVTKALEGCIKEIKTKLQCKWEDTKCKSCRDKMTDPVFLPCKHYVCLKCIPAQHAAERSCAQCRTKIPEDFELSPVNLTPDQCEELKRFQSACTSFFLEYLSTFCFPATTPSLAIEEKTLDLLLEKLVICDKSVSKAPGVLSDFGVDFVGRSYILQLLLGSSPNHVEMRLNNHLQALRNELQNKADLFDIYIHCDRNILVSNIQSIDEDDDCNTEIQSAITLFNDCVDAHTNPFNQLQHLDFSVKMQYIVQATVSSVYALHHKKAESLHEKQIMTQLVQNVCQLCLDERFEMVQRAIVKELCLKHGMEAFKVLAEDNEFRHLIPLYLQPDEEEDEETNLYLEADNLVLCGDSYQRTKDNLQGLTKPGDFPKVFQGMVHEIQQSQDSIFQALLALSTWTGKGAVSKALRRETFKHMTDRLHTHFAGKSYQQAFSDIADNKLTCKKCEGMSDQLHHKLTELIIVFCLTSLWRADGLLADLHGLISDPKQYQKAFLPTMPASGYFQVKDLLAKDIGAYGLAPKAFVCPNGHLYFIGDCTKPNQSGICPDCQQPIGGQSYDKLHAGSKEGDITEESQAGYKLKSARDQPPVTPERELSKLSVCALRFCLHAAMLLGSRNGNIVQQMIDNQDPSVFFVQHMMKDLADLAECLGKSIDDATMIMHEILRRMRLSTIPIDQAACNLKTMKARDAWEKEFQRHYLTMVFKDAENIINKARNVMVNAGNMTEKPLESLVFELDLDGNLPEGIVPWDCPCLWKSRKHIDIKHLNLKLEAVDANAGGEGAVLKTVLNMENLHLVQHLDVIFDLQSIVMGRYRQKIDLVDADEITLGKFLDDDEYISEAKVDLYIKIWNKIRFSLSKTPSYKPLHAYFKADMDRESPISMCIPSKRGRGRCAYVLVEYLIGKQNDIIQQCRDHVKPRPSFAQMDVPKLSKRDIICISKTDLMPLIQANHQYDNTDNDDQTGPRHRIVYDFGLLEKKVVEKFISRKAEIKCETVPLMQYPQDVGLSKDFVAVQKRINQIPLPVRMCHDIDTFVENSQTANICEAVRTVTIVIQFLAKLGAEGDQTICDYSEKELLLPPEETEMIPRSALISHCLALYERLSWHRSKRLMQNGQNPFENVLECAERIEDEEVEEKLTEELKGMNIERLQLELNAVMMFGPEMQPDWSLGSDVLFYYLEGKHEKADNSWCEKLPEEVLYKHAAHVFELSMELVESN